MAPQRTILFVDDDPEDQLIIREAFESKQSEIFLRFANNGKEGLQILEECLENDQLPSLVVLDLNMPKLNGTQTLEAIRQNDRFLEVPVVIYTTSVNPLEKAKCMALGARDYVVKPISIRQSVETAERFLQIAGS